MTKYYIYEIRNTIDAKVYVGSTKNPKKRWNYHIHCDKEVLLYQHIKTLGVMYFEMNVVDEIETDDCSAVLTLEQYYIDKINFANRLNMNAAILTHEQKKQWRKEYNESRKEVKKEYDKEYARTHPDQCRKYKKNWREKNPDYHKEYREKNYDKVIESERLRRHKNRETLNAKKRIANLTQDQIDKTRLYGRERAKTMTDEQKEKRRKYMREYMKRPEQREKHRIQETKRRNRLKNKNIV